MRVVALLPLVVQLIASCGSSDSLEAPVVPDAALPDGPEAADAMAQLADSSSAPIPVVPDPGTGPLPMAWPDTEPNDTPEQAVPIGMGAGQIGPYIGLFDAEDGHLGAGDEADYFVFRTAPVVTSMFIAGACWDAALNIDLLDFALYKVIDGQPLVLVTKTSTPSTSCEVQQPFSIPLDADSKYLFAVTHVAGEGSYSA
jgi:hypothetical protein